MDEQRVDVDWKNEMNPSMPNREEKRMSEDERDFALERKNALMNSFGGSAYRDGLVQAEINKIDAQLANSPTVQAFEAQHNPSKRTTPGERQGESLDQKRYAAHDWGEDGALENGRFFNTCGECRVQFVGHKRRVICKQCAPRDRQAIAVAERYQAHGGAIYIPRMIDSKARLVMFTSSDDEKVHEETLDWWFANVYPHATPAPARSRETVTPAPADHFVQAHELVPADDPKAVRCHHCDFGSGQRGMDNCGVCKGLGYIEVPVPADDLGELERLAKIAHRYGNPIIYDPFASPERIQSLIDRVRAAEGKLASLPADWFVDSSLATWFPITSQVLRERELLCSEMLEKLRAERAENVALRESLAILKRDADRGFRDLQATLATMIAAKKKELQS